MKGAYRSIGINRNDFVALLQLRPDMPEESRAIEWIAYASNALNTMVPFYANIDTTPAYLANTTGEVSTDNFYWASRMIAAMADASFAKSQFHLERYELAVLSESRAILNDYDAKLAAEPDAAARAATRAAWGITDTDRLAGFVGRLNHQKNPLFLMEVFAAMAAQDPHWKLLLVGTGEMEPEMRAAAARRGLTDRVIFAGVQSDVPAFMNAFDLFLLPSNFEGSPVTLVEAQGCGVPCLASTNVPDDGSVTDLVHFLPLAAPLTDWAAKAEAIAAHGDHDDHWAALSAAGYELKTAARRMEQLYDKLGGHA